MADTKFQIGAEVTFFKTSLVGMIDSVSKKILIRQPQAGVEAAGLTLDEFRKEIENVFSQFEIPLPTINLPEIVTKVTEGIRVYLNEIFMLVDYGKNKSVEFAIWVSMDATLLKQELQFPISLDRAYIKVWNTDNPTICDEMDITIIQKLLESAPAGQGGGQDGQ